MQRETAEILALDALGWLASDDELLGLFLGSSGAAVSDLKARAQDPDFLASVLDFLLTEDAWVLAAAKALGVVPERLAAARRALPGGATVDWT